MLRAAAPCGHSPHGAPTRCQTHANQGLQRAVSVGLQGPSPRATSPEHSQHSGPSLGWEGLTVTPRCTAMTQHLCKLSPELLRLSICQTLNSRSLGGHCCVDRDVCHGVGEQTSVRRIQVDICQRQNAVREHHIKSHRGTEDRGLHQGRRQGCKGRFRRKEPGTRGDNASSPTGSAKTVLATRLGAATSQATQVASSGSRNAGTRQPLPKSGSSCKNTIFTDRKPLLKTKPLDPTALPFFSVKELNTAVNTNSATFQSAALPGHRLR